MKDIVYEPQDWELWDSKRDEIYVRWIGVHERHKDNRNSYWMDMYELVCQTVARRFMLMNFWEGAAECLRADIDINEAYINKLNSKKHKKMTEIELKKKKLIVKANLEYSKWLLGDKPIDDFSKCEIQVYKFRLENGAKKVVEKKQRGSLIRVYIKHGYYEKAKELNKIQYTSKVVRKLKTEDIYTRDKFFYYLTEYLINPWENKENEQAIKDCFTYFFDELLKGNRSLYKYDEAGENMFVDDMAYIWYKYFSDVPFEQIKPSDIVKCRRYGIIGIHCDKIE